MAKRIAIVGASTDRGKYGNKAVRAYVKAGWEVFPVHPKAPDIEGRACHARIEDVPGPLDRVSMYLRPELGLELAPAIARAHPGVELWLNPGAESPELAAAAREQGLKPVEACSIVDIGMRPAQFPDH